MAKMASSGVLDGTLEIVRKGCTGMSVCAGAPGTASAASSANMLAQVTMTTGTGDYTLSGVSSRAMEVAAKAGVSIAVTGVADHVALYSTTLSVLFVTTVSSQALASGGTVDISTWSAVVEQPV